jgi:hypothetical protein
LAHQSGLEASQEAITEFRVLGPMISGCSWIELRPVTSSKHQVPCCVLSVALMHMQGSVLICQVNIKCQRSNLSLNSSLVKPLVSVSFTLIAFTHLMLIIEKVNLIKELRLKGFNICFGSNCLCNVLLLYHMLF